MILNGILTELYVAIGYFLTALTTWFFARKMRKTELKSAQNDLEIKLTEKYEALLDNFDKRLKNALDDLDRATNAVRERDRQIDELTRELRIRDKKIDDFMLTVENLTQEIRKYKQLNGKTE